MATTNINNVPFWQALTWLDVRIMFPCSQSAFCVTPVQTKKYLGASERANDDTLVACTVMLTLSPLEHLWNIKQNNVTPVNGGLWNASQMLQSLLPPPRFSLQNVHLWALLSSAVRLVLRPFLGDYRATESRRASWQCVLVWTSIKNRQAVCQVSVSFS